MVDRAPKPYPGRCFWVVQQNGNKEDFSIKHCLEDRSSAAQGLCC
jgi:hypothetical protein